MLFVPGALSSASTSETASLKIVTVQVSPARKLTFGVMIQRAGVPAVVALLCGPVVAQVGSYHAPVTSTASLKPTVRLASRGAAVLLEAGEVKATDGPTSPG